MKCSINRFLLFIVILFLLTGCHKTSIYKSLDDAISKSIPYEISEILHKERMPDGVIVFYISPSQEYNLMGVAFFKGNDEKGWENIGPKDLVDYYDEQISYNVETVTMYPLDPIQKQRVQVIFGQINDIGIKDVKVAGRDGVFVSADIIENPNGRFYFKVGNHTIVQGLDINGDIILQLGD